MLKGYIRKHAYHTADTGAGTGGSGSQQGADQSQQPTPGAEGGADAETPLTWDAWFGALPDDHKDLIATHTGGLKKALDAERDRAKAFEKQIKGISKQVEAGSDAAQALEKLQTELQAANQRASFYQAAIPNEVAPDAIELAYMAASTGGFLDSSGDVDWKTLKTAYPRLFAAPAATPPVRANAGAGVGQRAAVEKTVNERMNTAIRDAFGRKNG